MIDIYKRAYSNKKKDAKRRGIEFCMTLEQFTAVWEESGKFDQMGNKKGQYVMARIINYGNIFEKHDTDYYGNLLPYDVDTVQIIIGGENKSAAHKGKNISDKHKARISAIHKGKNVSDETKAKLRAAHLGKKRDPISEKTRENMRKGWIIRKSHV